MAWVFARGLLLAGVEGCLLGRSSTSFRCHPRRRSGAIAQQFLKAPDVIREPTGHGRSPQHFSRFSLSLGCPSAQFMMGPTEVVRTSQQPHPVFQSCQPSGRMPTLARQTGQSLTHRAVQAFNKGRIEHRSPLRSGQQRLGVLERSQSHLARDFHHPLLFRAFDDRGDTELGPHPQTGSPASCSLFDASRERLVAYCLGRVGTWRVATQEWDFIQMPPCKPRMHLSMHVAFQHQQDDSVRERDIFLRCGRPYWISLWQVRPRTSVLRWRAAMVCTHRGFSRPVYFSRSLSARM